MSKNKRDRVTSDFYAPFLATGQPFAYNPVNVETAQLQSMYIRVLQELSANRFKWDGMPPTIDERFLELELMRSGLVVFYYAKEYRRYLALKATGFGKNNMYDNPTSFHVTGGGHIQKTLKPTECVPIYSNYLRVPDMDIVQIYARKLAQIDRTIEINSTNMRQSKIIVSTESERLSMVNIAKQIDEGQPNIYTTRALDTENIKALDLSVHPDSLPKLLIARSKMWNDCMTLLGINNSNQDKAERLVAAEVGANDEQIAASRAVSLGARTQAAEQINRMFPDLNVSVRFKLDDETAPPQTAQPPALDDRVDPNDPGAED